ncbi:hypothetical protein Glove_218g42 [Diversispora epigaea]|uniref:Uncharacterized protein n=1 Tax=Diversispora epigaea TaxID=1348612 RepID=A0A397IGF2_9GLOM|nr:hypothetical protein Glove_218g42 [Diversispora epigaea]
MNAKREREMVIKAILRNECDNYLHEFLILRREQASFVKEIQAEHSSYYVLLLSLKNDRELEVNVKNALDTFEGFYQVKASAVCLYDGLRFGLYPARASAASAVCLYDGLRFGLYPARASAMEKKSSDVTNFWKEVQKSDEEENAIRSASLGHLNIFGKTLTQYANEREGLIENISTNHHRKQEIEVLIDNKEISSYKKGFYQVKASAVCLYDGLRFGLYPARASAILKPFSLRWKKNLQMAPQHIWKDGLIENISTNHHRKREIEVLIDNEEIGSYKKEKKNTENDPDNNDNLTSGNDEDSSAGFEDEEEIKFDLINILKELNREPTVKWEVGHINVINRFWQYQKIVLAKAQKMGLKDSSIYELLALASIIVFCCPCPYSNFTNQEWKQIIKTNPYTLHKSPLLSKISSSLQETASRRLIGGDVFMDSGKSELNRIVALMFNNLYYGIPDVAPSKLSEEEHCDMFIYPIARLFHPYKNYNI